MWQLYGPATFILNPKSKNIAKYINAYEIGTVGSDVFDLKGKLHDSDSNKFVFTNSPAEDKTYFAYRLQFTHLFDAFPN